MPSLAARRLGKRLRAQRIEAGLSPYDVATSRITNRRSLGRYESGEAVPAWPIADALAELYGAPRELRDRLKERAIAAADAVDVSERNRGAAPPAFGLLLDLEEDAATIDRYDPEVLGGPFQTTDTARAILEASPLIDADQIEATLETRIARRKRVLPGPSGPKVRALVTQGALDRQIGGPDVHREQLDSLRADAARPNVEIRWLPNDVGAYGAVVGPFQTLTFADELDPVVTYLETLLGATYIEAKQSVDLYRVVYEKAWSFGRNVV